MSQPALHFRLWALLCCCTLGAVSAFAESDAAPLWVTYEGTEGPGLGRKIVLISGDEEYRSEEGLPQLGKILAGQHGFTCTVLFPIDPKTGTIAPDYGKNIPGLEALRDADLVVMLLRFRDLPNEQMQHIDDYLRRGGPIVALRTSTHAFNTNNPDWKHYSNGYNGDRAVWKDGFGRLVLGEKWISHHGHHKREGTRGVIAGGHEEHPIVRGIGEGEIFGDSDVYGVRLPLPGDSNPIVLGEVVSSLDYDAPAVDGKKNDPMMPVAWTKSYQIPGGEMGRVFCTTMGAATDLQWEGTRRLIVNGVYWALGMGDEIPEEGTAVELVGEYDPSPYSFGGFKKGIRPAEHLWKVTE